MIEADVEKQLKQFLEKWANDFKDKLNAKKLETEEEKIELQKLKEGKSKPFHEALLSKEILEVNSFERSFSTSLGNSFEGCAKIIAAKNFEIAELQYEVKGKISNKVIKKVEEFCDYVGSNGRPKNYLDYVGQVVSIKETDSVERRKISDLYIKDSKGNETFFEMKSPKPNKGQCVEVLGRHLEMHAIRKAEPPKVKTFFAMAYNPYGTRKDYKHSFSINYLDMENHVLLGSEFWDYLGGKGTNEEIIRIYEEFGQVTGKGIFEKLILGK